MKTISVHQIKYFLPRTALRIGRAATGWQDIACSESQWDDAVRALRERAESASAPIALSIYPWDILTEMEKRLADPQAMLLVVPNRKVKLLNALPFAVADLRLRTSEPQPKASALADLLGLEAPRGGAVEVGGARVQFLPGGPEGRPELYAERFAED